MKIIRPEKSFRVKTDGFYGDFYRASHNSYTGKALIAFGGSAGTKQINRLLAGSFCDAGMDVMVIEYHGQDGLPKDLQNQPVETVELAAKWLKGAGYRKIGVWGISMGTCLAVLAAAEFPDLISCVVLVSPMHMVTQAEKRNDSGVCDGSAFALNGKPYPYAKWNMDTKTFNRRYHRDCIKQRDLYCKGIIEDAYRKNTDPAALLPVQNMKASVLLISGEKDGMCPAKESSRIMMRTMEEHSYPYTHKHLNYEHLGHFILPFKPIVSFLLRAERENPKACNEERAEAWEATQDFLKNEW